MNFFEKLLEPEEFNNSADLTQHEVLKVEGKM